MNTAATGDTPAREETSTRKPRARNTKADLEQQLVAVQKEKEILQASFIPLQRKYGELEEQCKNLMAQRKMADEKCAKVFGDKADLAKELREARNSASASFAVAALLGVLLVLAVIGLIVLGMSAANTTPSAVSEPTTVPAAEAAATTQESLVKPLKPLPADWYEQQPQ